MGKANKHKKEKVPKITEEEYAAYLSALKVGEEGEADKKISVSSQTEGEQGE